MQPIKTTNAMNPAPAKGIQSLPTPVIDDVIITEMVNAWKGDYQKLEYGTMWDSVPHGSQQGSFPEHKLVFQQVSSEDGQWVKRIWVNDRVNQDSYNYAIKYSAGSQAHPIYTRTYVVPRETYFPLVDLTPDDMFPNALLVDEVANRSENELDSKYITVTRVFETLPGPEVPSKRYNERGDLESISTQVVVQGTPPTEDGLLITGSQVIQQELGKGVKTTSSVTSHSTLRTKEKKEGLLGETITTDDIVDPSTEPDALSESVVASVVQQTSATKAVKRTTTASGPTNLAQKSKDGKLLGDVISTQSIVAPNTNPDSPSSTILSSEVNQVDSGKAIKTNVVLNSTPTLSGNQSEQGLLGVKSTTESIVTAGALADALSLSVISSVVEPIDSVRSRKVTVTSSGPSTLLGGQNKEGLLGETNINESIVASGTSPDALSQTIVSSVIEPIDSAKSKKTTITSTGPTTLSGKENKDGLMGRMTRTETIVPAGTAADTLTFNTISSEVTPIDSSKSKKTTITHNGPNALEEYTLIDSPSGLIKAAGASYVYDKTSIIDQDKIINLVDGSFTTVKASVKSIDETKVQVDVLDVFNWPILNGVEYDEVLGIPITYTERVVSPDEYKNPPTDLSNSNNSYKPLDQWKTLRRSYDKRAIATALLEQYFVTQTQVQINLPNKLLEVTAYISRDYSEGKNISKSENVGGDSYGFTNGGGFKSSGSISADVYFKLENGFNGYIDGEEHTFFMEISADGRVNESIIKELNDRNDGKTYLAWPNIKKITENVLLFTGGKSKTQSDSRSEDVSINGFAEAARQDVSFDIDTNVNTVTLPDALHGVLQINEVYTGPEIPDDLQIQGGVQPKVLEATSPAIFPIGNYLISSSMDLFKYGLVKVKAITVTITDEYV